MKQLLFLLLLSITSVAGMAQDDDSKDLYLTKGFSDASFRKIYAECSHGNIEVLTAGGKDAKVEVFIHGKENNRTLSKDEIKSVLDEYYSLEISVSGDVLTVHSKKKSDFFNRKNWLSISFRIYAGKDKSTELLTDHGNIRLAGMTGSQELTTDHGDIDATDISGRVIAKTDHGNVKLAGLKDGVDARTDHGDVEIKESNGTVKLVTSNGNITLTSVKGSLRADTDHGDVSGVLIGGDLVSSTSHGNIDLDRISCSVDASTDHGNLAVHSDKLTGNIVLKNSNGDINLQLPKGDAIDLDLRGAKVVVGTIANFSGTGGNEFLRGTLNGGGSKVIAKTDKGQVDLAFR